MIWESITNAIIKYLGYGTNPTAVVITTIFIFAILWVLGSIVFKHFEESGAILSFLLALILTATLWVSKWIVVLSTIFVGFGVLLAALIAAGTIVAAVIIAIAKFHKGYVRGYAELKGSRAAKLAAKSKFLKTKRQKLSQIQREKLKLKYVKEFKKAKRIAQKQLVKIKKASDAAFKKNNFRKGYNLAVSVYHNLYNVGLRLGLEIPTLDQARKNLKDAMEKISGNNKDFEGAKSDLELALKNLSLALENLSAACKWIINVNPEDFFERQA